jgi:hypothetical protein
MGKEVKERGKEMAKFEITRKPISIEVEGVKGLYVRNEAFSKIEALAKEIEEIQKEEGDTAGVVATFERLVCDQDGEAFEEFVSFEGICEFLSVRQIQDTMEAVAQSIQPTGAAAKN